MLIPKKNRGQIYEYLFKEGVLVAKKDLSFKLHPDVNVPSLEVIKACQVRCIIFITMQNVMICVD